MKNLRINLLLTSLLALFIFTSCSRDEEIIPADNQGSGLPDPANDADNIPQWINDEMDFFYFWNNALAIEDPTGDEDPESYFYSLLNSSDKFSYITDDAEAIKEETSGTIIAMGFSSSFGVFTNTNNLFAIVEYVYANSPAEKAGLKRGDIVLQVNGENLTENNYLDITDQNGLSLSLGKFNGRSIEETNETISINEGIIDLDPVIHHEVKFVEGEKVGYLVFVDFLAGENEKWLNSLGNALGEMKAEGISQLIVDLRYNPGGEVFVAEYLASALAPLSVVNNKEILVRFEYNENLQEYFEDRRVQNSSNLISRFTQNENNLNLNEIIFLTTGNTASASELVINGLKPYMGVTVIGEPTFGKFYGSFVLYDENEPPEHNWAIAPVVLKYANANGVTDFVNGLTPDIIIEDDLLNAKSFGDETDPMLATALSWIKGEIIDPSSARMSSNKIYDPVYDVNKINRKNIFFHGNPFGEVVSE
jgi:carboxyl-terminal processing protease